MAHSLVSLLVEGVVVVPVEQETGPPARALKDLRRRVGECQAVGEAVALVAHDHASQPIPWTGQIGDDGASGSVRRPTIVATAGPADPASSSAG
jgi:hypothetical protein